MKTITVFCSASDVEEKYRAVARRFGELMVSHGYDLVWGGSDMGIMKVIADSVQHAGGKLFGVSVEFLHAMARPNADEMVVTKDLSERKQVLLDKGSAIVLLVGGLGSLDEIAEIVEHKKHRHHNKPVVIINTDNFYDGLRRQLHRMHEEGFIDRSIEELVRFADTPEDAISMIDEALSPEES